MEDNQVVNEGYMKECVNRFEAVIIASKRVHLIMSGDPMAISTKKCNSKATVVALKEMSQSKLCHDKLKELVIAEQLGESITSEDKAGVINSKNVNMKDFEKNIFQEKEIVTTKVSIGIHNILMKDPVIQDLDNGINPYDSLSFDEEEEEDK